MIDLTGKVALVTGSSRGIGRGCAVEMARCGADVADRGAVDAMVEGAVAELGRAASFLCSDAADYINAEVLRVDGGYWFEHGLSR